MLIIINVFSRHGIFDISFDTRGTFLLSIRNGFRKNVIIFGADNIPSANAGNSRNVS